MLNKNSFANYEMEKGELVVRFLSEIAQEYYDGTDSTSIAVKGTYPDERYFVSYDFGNSYSESTLKEIESCFEEMRREEIRQEAIEAMYDDDLPYQATYWREIAEKYGLTEEFEENAII